MKTVNTFVPDRDELRALYNEAIAELNPYRENKLTTPFYWQMANAVFETCFTALSDAKTGNKVIRTLSAAPGTGKTTFTHAMLIALARYGERHPNEPVGAVLVVNEIKKADADFRSLHKHIPNNVAVYSEEHNSVRIVHKKLTDEPIARFAQHELRDYTVAICTHQFFLDVNWRNVGNVSHNGKLVPRILVVVDEQANEVPTKEITLAEAEKTLEELVEASPDAKEPLNALLLFMGRFHSAEPNKLFRPGLELSYTTLRKELGWFATNDATKLAKFHSDVQGADKLLTYAKALVAGTGWVATDALFPHFVWHEEYKILDRSAGGVVLMDATASIDGIAEVVGDRIATEPPAVSYSNMTVILVPQHTKSALNTYFRKVTNRASYVQSMLNTIENYMPTGENGLVVSKLALFDNRDVPNWNIKDERHNERRYTEDFIWNLEGRNLAATWWGTGAGSNKWGDARYVFLFDAHIIPRRASVARLQGYRSHRAHEGDLGGMETLMSKAQGVDTMALGDVLRHIKQIALRGNARNYDQFGVCGEQTLVISGDVKKLLPYIPIMFPGVVNIRTERGLTEKAPWSTKVLELLSSTDEDVLTTAEIGRLLGKDWRDFSHHVLTDKFKRSAEALGWLYVGLKGRSGKRFERTALGKQEDMPPSFLREAHVARDQPSVA